VNREFDDSWDQPQSAVEETGIDFETDMVTVRVGIDSDPEGSPNPSLEEAGPEDDPAWSIASADVDNVLDELVDLVNGRDLDGLGEVLSPDATADFLGATSGESIIDGLSEMVLRNPTLIVTRGELGPDPVVAVWLFDEEAHGYDLIGYFSVELTENDDRLIQRMEYIEELPDSGRLTVETPDRVDLPEWDDWSINEEG